MLCSHNKFEIVSPFIPTCFSANLQKHPTLVCTLAPKLTAPSWLISKKTAKKWLTGYETDKPAASDKSTDISLLN